MYVYIYLYRRQLTTPPRRPGSSGSAWMAAQGTDHSPHVQRPRVLAQRLHQQAEGKGSGAGDGRREGEEAVCAYVLIERTIGRLMAVSFLRHLFFFRTGASGDFVIAFRDVSLFRFGDFQSFLVGPFLGCFLSVALCCIPGHDGVDESFNFRLYCENALMVRGARLLVTPPSCSPDYPGLRPAC